MSNKVIIKVEEHRGAEDTPHGAFNPRWKLTRPQFKEGCPQWAASAFKVKHDSVGF